VDDGGRVGLLTLSLQRGRLLILHGVGCETATAALPLAVCGQIEFAVVVFFFGCSAEKYSSVDFVARRLQQFQVLQLALLRILLRFSRRPERILSRMPL